MSLTEKTGLAMYTIHRAVRENMEDAFERIAELGVRGIEFYGELEEFSPAGVKNALSRSGMVITGWHLDWKRLHELSFSETVKHLQECGCPIAIVQCLGGKWKIGHDEKGECRDRWLYYAEWMNGVYEKLKKEGIRLGYHNHEHEFSLHYDGKTVYDLLYENLDRGIVMELDSGNCIEGGEDAAEVLKKYTDRKILLHLKPYSFQKEFDVVLGEKEDANDWQKLLTQTEADIEWILLESENTSLPEMVNVEKCIRNLKKYLT